MFEFLKHITPRIKLLSLSILLIFLPGAIISYLSLKSIQDKAENQRIEYRGTADLVRDKLESTLFQEETNFRNSAIDTLINLNVDSNKQSLLQSLELLNPTFKNLFLVTPDAGLINSSVTLGLRNPDAPQGLSVSPSTSRFSRAEEAEFIRRNYSDALSNYEKALAEANSPLDHALIQSRIGRIHFKQGKFKEGILEYKKLTGFEYEDITIGQVPASTVAYYQISRGYQALASMDDYQKNLLELYRQLLNNPWDLAGGEYLYYLRSATQELLDIASINQFTQAEKEKLDEWKIKEEELLESIKLMDIINKYLLNEIRSDLNSTLSSEIKHQLFQIEPGAAIELGYFHPPPTHQKSEIIALGFQYDEKYILTELFPRVLSTVELGKDISVGILNEKDSLLFCKETQQVTQYLVAENFKHSLHAWKVALFDKGGKTIEQLAGREKRLYLALFLGILAVMLIGIIVLARAVIHESEITRLKSEFVSNVTHELKTPLSLIRMFGETLDSGIVTEESKRKEFYSIIREESERLTHLINNVLDFSRMDSARKEYNFQETDLVLLVRHSLKAYKFHIRDKGFDIESKLPEDPVMVKIDKDAISQTLLNLLSNSVKYSDDKKHIQVEVCRSSGSAIITVTDQGIGIAREELKKIFDKFYRIPNANTRQSRGSGLGLTLSRSIVEAHDGNIAVVSEPGKGSTFTISIPLM